MNQLIEFASDNALLVAAFFAVLTLLIVNLLKDLKDNGQVSVNDAVMLINRQGAAVVDVRPKDQFSKGHIKGALNVPLADLSADRLKKVRGKPVLLVCESGPQSAAAAGKLADWPDKVSRLRGGLASWRTENLPLSKGA